MQIIESYNPDCIQTNTAVALGMFDGVHLGHKKIINATIDYAKKHGLESAVVTLKKHPRLLVEGQSPKLLTDLDSKLRLFDSLGLDNVLLLDFTTELREMPPELYIQKYLMETLKAKYISVGYNHHFGKDRSGGPAFLKDWTYKNEIGLYVCEPVSVHDEIVSSSRIREYIQQGNICKANDLLGHDYALAGTVIKGEGRGRELGFPTANVEVNETLCLPKVGVYSADIRREGNSEVYSAVVNLGYRPTFNASPEEKNIEAHILNFDQDIYGEHITLDFKKRIRDEYKFNSKDELVNQIKQDISQV